MNTSRNVLGKGLSSLIPNANKQNYWGPTVAPQVAGEQIVQVSTDAIASNPWQPRAHFDDEKLGQLADSIREYGIIQPLVVTQAADGAYQLIAGERRLKAARMLKLPTVPVVVRKAEEQKKLELSLVENIQRHDLNPLEEALSFKRLMDEFSLTQEEVAQRVGRSRSSVANFLRILTLPRPALEAIEQEKITFSHAKAILSYDTEALQLAALEKILRNNLTVAEVSRPPKKPREAPVSADPVLAAWEEKLTTKLGFKARIKKMGSGGAVEIIFHSEEDLKSLLDRLLAG